MIEPLHAVILGALEGLTEFLPISSTGHLILASRVLGLSGDAVKTFEVVIQAGALVAVLGLYRNRIAQMWLGLKNQHESGRRFRHGVGPGSGQETGEPLPGCRPVRG